MDIFENLKKRLTGNVANEYVFNDIYFGENGLTSTSANHVSAMANTFATDTKERMKTLRLHIKRIRVIGDEDCIVEDLNDILYDIPQGIKDISKANSLIAWLREAIKEREDGQNNIIGYTIEKYAKKFGIELPEKPVIPVPATINLDDKKTILEAGLTIKEYNRFIELCSTLAVYGDFIHDKGMLTVMKHNLQRMTLNPMEVKENGRDTMITSYQVFCEKDLNNIYNKLQDEYRKLQAEKNGIMAKYEKLAVQYQLKKKAEYDEEFAKWKKDTDEYNANMATIQCQMQDWKKKECERIAELKIIIPNDLSEIYHKIISHQI